MAQCILGRRALRVAALLALLAWPALARADCPDGYCPDGTTLLPGDHASQTIRQLEAEAAAQERLANCLESVGLPRSFSADAAARLPQNDRRRQSFAYCQGAAGR